VILIRILLVDDHHIVRQGIRSLLTRQPDMEIIGDTESGVQAVALVESLRPHILLADLKLSDLTGLEVTRQVRKNFPETRVIMLSMYGNVPHVAEALRSGAHGYVLKEADIGELVAAVRAVIKGRVYLSPAVDVAALEDYLCHSESPALDPYESLTQREREVLLLVAQGLTSAEIAEHWVVSKRTVETHRANLMHKLDLHSHAELVRFALARGLLPMDE
jgi:DNA-binding NarL/FixJ family response regulator